MALDRRTFLASLGASIAPPAAPAADGRPNFILILADDLGFSDIGPSGGEIATPNLDRLARRGVRFTQFYNCARCCPTRASLLTGMDNHSAGIGHMIQDRGVPGYQGYLNDKCRTIAEVLKPAGYSTWMSGKWHVGENKPHWPLDRGFDRYFGLISGASNYFRLPPGRKMALDAEPWEPRGDGFYMTDAFTDHAVRMIGEAAAGQHPFFLYLAYTAPHHIAKPPARYKDLDVYIPPRRPNFNEADVSDKPLFVRRMPLLTEAELAEWDAERANSQRELMAVDDGVQAIMQKLQETGELDNTVVIYLADQGFSWGAHRWLYKNCPYRECSNFPLFIRMPGGGPNRVEARLVSNVDIAPTIIELASGATIKGRVPDGRSLVPLLTEPEKPWAEGVLLERHHGDPPSRFFGVQTPGYMYAEYQNGDAELYDMAADPYQMDNVVDDPAYAAVRAEMAALLQSLLAGVPLPEPVATATQPPSPVDPTGTATQTAAPTETATSTTTAPTVSAPTLSATPPSPTATATGTPPSPTATTTGAPPTATTEPTPTATLPAFTPTAFHFLPVQLRAGE